MGPFGVPELAIILVIVVIIFGVGKLPEIGGAFGKGIKEFKTQAEDTAPPPMPIGTGTGERASSLTDTAGPRPTADARTAASPSGTRSDDV